MRLLVFVLLAMPQTMHSQDHTQTMRSQGFWGTISKAFDKVISTKGITYSTIRDEHREDSVVERTVIYNISVGRPNFKVFDELKNAFLADEEGKTSVYTCFGPLDDAYRQQWAVKLRRGSDFRVGQKSGSSYAIATFDDPQHTGYRTVYAAEWWDTDNADIRQGVLLASYGEKPTSVGAGPVPARQGAGSASARSAMAEAEARLQEARSLIGGTDWAALRRQYPSLTSVDSLLSVYFHDNKADFATDPQGWMLQAISNASNLDEADWLRLFGMLTQKMIDRADKESSEDLIVAAGILLDMCKESVDLDKDEKDICAARLKEVASWTQSRSQYVHDLLLLAAKRLQKK